MSLELAMQWNTTYDESVHTFANTINTHEGGTHEEGFRASLTTLVNSWGEEWGLIKKARGPRQGRRHPRGPDRDHLDQAGRPAVRGPDQDQARQHRGQGLRAADRQRPARRLAGEEPGRGQGHRPQGPGRRLGAGRRPQGARPRPLPQGPARRRRSARQAQRLPVDQPRGVRGLHRRGRLGGRLGAPGPRPADPGDPADPRQDPQRREGPASTRCWPTRGPGDHLRARHGRARGVRPRQAALPQDRADGRRRRRRPSHQHAVAHAAVPVHEAADRERLRLHGPAAALPAALEQAGRARVRLLRLRARPADARRPRPGQEAAQGEPRPALQGPRRDERRGAVGDDDGPRASG